MFNHRDWLTTREFPNTRGVVACSARNHLTIVTKSDAYQSSKWLAFPVSLQREQMTSIRDLPNVQHIVITSGRNPLPIWTERDAADLIGVSKCKALRAVARPNVNVPCLTGSGNQLPICIDRKSTVC